MTNHSLKVLESQGSASEASMLELSRLVTSCEDWKKTLDEFVRRLRNVFIFDNIVLYQTDFDTHRLEVIYARALGRGKSAEADSNWGESIAAAVAQEQKSLLDHPVQGNGKDRLSSPVLLGIPLMAGKNLPGSLVFIRFGGPDFGAPDQELAQIVAQQISGIVGKKIIADMGVVVENQRKASQLQEEFIHTVSHELRSPLGFIKGYVTTLLREDIQWEKKTQTDFLNIIDRETNHLEDLFDNLLDSARLQSGQLRFDLQVVRVDSLIRDEVKRAQLNHPEMDVHFDFEPEVPPIEGDPRRLAQVFDNLLSNSLKYAPGASLLFRVRHDAQSMTIYYSNNGPRIPEPYLSQIFTRFYRTPDQSIKAHGTGLGLYICKQIVEQHRGTLTASSPEEGGVLFTITLPIGSSSCESNE